MKLYWQRFLAIIGILLALGLIPFIIIWQELVRSWNNLYIFRSIKSQYISTTKDFLQFWKYDFDVKKINEVEKQEMIDRIINR